MNKTSKNRV